MPTKTTAQTNPAPCDKRAASLVSAAVAIMLLHMPTAALAQSRTIYGSDGRVIAREHTDSRGNTTIYDASGKVQSRTSTSTNGATTLYGADGRVSARTSTSGNTTTIYGADGRKAGSITKSQTGR